MIFNTALLNLPTGIIKPVESPNYRSYIISALLLIVIGWGGLFLLLTQTMPYVWPRWGFFVLVLIAVTGTVLPIIYFLHRRFPDDPPADANVIVRQAIWFGIYFATLAWLQLGRLVTVYVILGLAGGLIAIEYFLRLRERAHWTPPIDPDE